MKKFFISISLFIPLVLCLTLLLEACGSNVQTTSGIPQPISTSISTSIPDPTPQNVKIPQWISLASHYIHVSNYTATIDPALFKNLNAQTVSLVQRSVNRYNKLDFSLRKNGKTDSKTTSNGTTTPTTCKRVIRATVNWWGVTIFMNDCAAKLVADGTGSVAVATDIAATSEAFVDLPLDGAAAVATVLGLYGQDIGFWNDYCSGNGANLNTNWFGDIWVSPVC